MFSESPVFPRAAEKILRRILPRHDFDSLAAGFQELHAETAAEKGAAFAGLWLWGQILRSLPGFAQNALLWRIIMIRNMIRMTLRNFRRHKAFTIINLSGLAIGMAASLLILLWVRDELSYNRFHPDADRIHRVVADSGRKWPVISIPVGPALKRDFPEIEESARYARSAGIFSVQDKVFRHSGAFVDPAFLKIFAFPLLSGDPDSALDSPDALLITETMAEKFFGQHDPVGGLIRMDNDSEFRVTGIIKKLPSQTDFRFDYLLPFEVFRSRDRDPDNWDRFQVFTYVQLVEKADLESVQEKISGYLEPHGLRKTTRLELEPLTQLHLNSGDGNNYKSGVIIFSIIAAIILTVACLNFANLSTARSSGRAREIGLRKVTGATRGDLARQVMGEFMLLSLLAMLAALALVMAALPAFNGLTAKTLTPRAFFQGAMLLLIPGLVLLSGALSGSYPALFLSSLRPLRVLKGNVFPSGSRPGFLLLRRLLVLLQFGGAIFLIIVTLAVSAQLRFIQNRDLGYRREHVIYLPLQGNMKREFETLRGELLQNPGILQVTAADQLPLEIGRSYNSFEWEGMEADQKPSLNLTAVDHEYFETMGMRIVEGRGFSRKYPSDGARAYVLNQSAVRAIELTSPVNRRFAAPTHDGPREGTIVGVVEDFHFRTLHDEIGPLVMMIEPDRFQYLLLRISAEETAPAGLIKSLEKTWKDFAPGFPFQYGFLDGLYDRMYRAEQRTGRLVGYFTLLAVFISCLGLFGLAMFMAEQRTREIGIRKILGASSGGISLLLSRQFLVPVLLANLIAWPAAFFASRAWLANFVYRADPGPGLFALAGGMALAAAMITVAVQSIRAAHANPVDSLRNE